jgi:hypothetical protein
MGKAKTATLRKPVLSGAEVLQFAEKSGEGRGKSSAAGAAKGAKSGLVPAGDARLTANIREDLHLKLKIRAAQERTTVGELIERWVQSWGK